MTLDEAEIIGYTFKSIKECERLGERIEKLYKEGKHEEITRIALELSSELKRVYEDKLSNYPSLNDKCKCSPKQ
jgi:hypothetical protein